MQEPEVNLALAIEHGLLEEEYNRIIGILGRTPSYTELGIFSVMWSEHCSYKNSISQLKTLPRSGGKLLVSAGEENAGLVDIGDGLAVAFKIESHNHPSAVEPYQGAATGVGGILRDIFTMGARPIAALNSLRFGCITPTNPPIVKEGTSDLSDRGVENSNEKLTEKDEILRDARLVRAAQNDKNDRYDRTKYLFKNVVKGVGDYGNCFGVPTVAGEIYFDESYRDNPLVNAMAVGIVHHNEVASATSEGVGNPVFLVGSSTGRDGIHGATFASEEISEKSESKRPSVQVGDPFTEKLLLEASLELIKSGIVVGMQDMGAAGITCSTSEMSAKGKAGMDINLDLVPAREDGMTAYEIMLSESQERMLVVIQKGKEEIAKKIFGKWDLNCVQIGVVTATENVKVTYKGKVMADVPADPLVLGGGAPVYERESRKPKYLDELRKFDVEKLPQPADCNEVLLRLLLTPNIASKNWVYEQYDTQVRTNTIILPGGDASVVRIKGTKKALAMKTDCNGRYVYLDPYKGTLIAVCESARNVVCTGAEPLAITNCLNFGNPYKPEVYYQFKEAIRGMGDACRILNTPVTGGNVSFYNESPDYAVYPTPSIGMVGLIEDVGYAMTSHFKNEGDLVAVIGKMNGYNKNDGIGGSEYLSLIHGKVSGQAPEIDAAYEKNLYIAALEIIRKKLISSAHDVSDGGIAVALAECCIMNRPSAFGCEVDLQTGSRPDFALFSESQSRIIVSLKAQNESLVGKICADNNIEINFIGKVTGNRLKINDTIDIEVSTIGNGYYDSIKNIMEA